MTGQPRTELPERRFTTEVMRQVLGTFCTGVVVVTGRGEQPLGFTCQSFASLSLDPPLILFAVARTSTTWPAIRSIGSFCVNVLAADHEHLSRAFSRSGTDKYADVNWSASPWGAPVLDGVAAWMDCSLWAEYDGGDHTIVVGEVRDLAALDGAHPLLFWRGSYPTGAWSRP